MVLESSFPDSGHAPYPHPYTPWKWWTSGLKIWRRVFPCSIHTVFKNCQASTICRCSSKCWGSQGTKQTKSLPAWRKVTGSQKHNT